MRLTHRAVPGGGPNARHRAPNAALYRARLSARRQSPDEG